MKSLLILVTVTLCWKLYDALTIHDQLLETWYNPPPAFKQKINLTVPQYAYWTALTKFVAPRTKLQKTYVTRFCKCDTPFVKRSLMSPVKKKRAIDFTEHIGSTGIRREWRRMSVSMRQLFIKHFNRLAKKGNLGRLQIFANWHRSEESPAAHGGPAFLPWHREFLFRLENALRDDGYPGTLPYWNSGLDHPLPNPRESAIFTTKELGVSTGDLRAPFKIRARGDCAADPQIGPIVKRSASSFKNYLFYREKADNLPETGSFNEFAKKLSQNHDAVHVWVGGHMKQFHCTGYEPLFYLHHAYVDLLWEKFREKQSRTNRTQDYPSDNDVTKPEHQACKTMLPFDDKVNIEGLQTQYTDVYYSYDHVPEQCGSDAVCNGPNRGNLLWCNNGMCQSKIRVGGECVQDLGNTQCHCAVQAQKPECVASICQCN